jgi:hypothetical protein
MMRLFVKHDFHRQWGFANGIFENCDGGSKLAA